MGPFTDLGRLFDWAIDGHMFRDTDGRLYFYYGKIHPHQFWHSIEHIWVQPMANATHLDRSFRPTEVLRPSQPWEFLNGGGPFKGVNEGPWIVKVEETYYLMYSGADAHSGMPPLPRPWGHSPSTNRTPSPCWAPRSSDP